MTNTQIRYMVEVAKAGSVNQAARNLFVSQSSLSNAIKSVENEFGRKIFRRSSRGMTLTPFGKLFIAYITPIEKQLRQLYAMRSSSPINSRRSLSIISNGFYYISDIIAMLLERHKINGLHITIREEYSGNVAEDLVSGEADLAIVRIWSCYRDQLLERFRTENLLYHPVSELYLGVDVGPQNPLYRVKSGRVIASQLQDYPQIMDESLDCGPYADIYPKIGLPVERNRLIVNSRAVTYELLNKTNGYVINSRMQKQAGLVKHDCYTWNFLPFEDCNISSEIGWVCKDTSVLTAEAKEFINLLQNNF